MSNTVCDARNRRNDYLRTEWLGLCQIHHRHEIYLAFAICKKRYLLDLFIYFFWLRLFMFIITVLTLGFNKNAAIFFKICHKCKQRYFQNAQSITLFALFFIKNWESAKTIIVHSSVPTPQRLCLNLEIFRIFQYYFNVIRKRSKQLSTFSNEKCPRARDMFSVPRRFRHNFWGLVKGTQMSALPYACEGTLSFVVRVGVFMYCFGCPFRSWLSTLVMRC